VEPEEKETLLDNPTTEVNNIEVEHTTCTSKSVHFIKQFFNFVKPPPCPWPGSYVARFVFVMVLITAIVCGAIFKNQLMDIFGPTGIMKRIVRNLGFMGYVAFAVLYVQFTIFMFPGIILTLAAGVIFDELYQAFIVISIGSTTGASLAFLLGRTMMRGWVQDKIKNYPIFIAVDRAIKDKGLIMVLLLRLSPVIPFSLLNYALSMTGIHPLFYIFGSWIGMMPGTFMYIYISWSTYRFATGDGSAQKLGNLLTYLGGGIATVAVVIIVTYFAKKEITKQLNEHKAEQESLNNDKKVPIYTAEKVSVRYTRRLVVARAGWQEMRRIRPGNRSSHQKGP